MNALLTGVKLGSSGIKTKSFTPSRRIALSTFPAVIILAPFSRVPSLVTSKSEPLKSPAHQLTILLGGAAQTKGGVGTGVRAAGVSVVEGRIVTGLAETISLP